MSEVISREDKAATFTANLKPFDMSQFCPKCGFQIDRIRFRNDEMGEYLSVNCTRCNHLWAMKCKDGKDA